MILMHQLNTENNLDFLSSVLLDLAWRLVFSYHLDDILSIPIIKTHALTFIYRYHLILSTEISNTGS